MSCRDIVKSIISRKTPEGYYVVVVYRNDRVLKILQRYGNQISVEEYSDRVVLKTKSRRIAEELSWKFCIENLLTFEL